MNPSLISAQTAATISYTNKDTIAHNSKYIPHIVLPRPVQQRSTTRRYLAEYMTVFNATYPPTGRTTAIANLLNWLRTANPHAEYIIANFRTNFEFALRQVSVHGMLSMYEIARVIELDYFMTEDWLDSLDLNHLEVSWQPRDMAPVRVVAVENFVAACEIYQPPLP